MEHDDISLNEARNKINAYAQSFISNRDSYFTGHSRSHDLKKVMNCSHPISCNRCFVSEGGERRGRCRRGREREEELPHLRWKSLKES